MCGSADAAVYDHLCTPPQVVKVQSVAKRFLVRIRYAGVLEEYNKAATQVQRIFRGALARERRNRMMWERETESRKLYMEALRAEDLHLAKEIRRVKRSIRRANFDTVYECGVQLGLEESPVLCVCVCLTPYLHNCPTFVQNS